LEHPLSSKFGRHLDEKCYWIVIWTGCGSPVQERRGAATKKRDAAGEVEGTLLLTAIRTANLAIGQRAPV